LLTVNKVAALIGSLDAALSERLAREAQPYGVTVIVSGELAANPYPEGAFTLGVSPGWRGQLLARLLLERMVDRVAVVTDSQSPVAGGLSAAFAGELRKNKGVTVREWAVDGAGDKSDWVAEAVSWKPAAVLVASKPADFRRDYQRLQRAGLQAPVAYGGEDVGTEAIGQGTGEILLATVVCAEGLSAKGKEMAERFAKANGQQPAYTAFQAYDALRLIYEGLKQAQASGSRLRERLPELEGFESVTGPLSFKKGRTLRSVFLVQLKGMQSKLLKSVPPEAP
jgi:ABC-type branched-subunit amino acid transport system substrate-binding protein